MTNNTHAARYAAAHETGSLEDPTQYHSIDRTVEVFFTDPRLAEITRLRVLTDWDFPFWDLSYCHGTLKDGTAVRVQLPEHQWSKRKGLKAELVRMCKDHGVYGKGIGILDAISSLD